MKIKSNIRKIAELGIGAIAITTLILAGCGGGGGSSALSTGLSIAASLGQFSQGTTIRVTGANKQTSTNTVGADGKAKVTIDGLTAPLLVEVLPDSNKTISFYDEKAGKIVSSVLSTTNTPAIRALVPDISAAVTAGVGVTALTEIAVGTLVDNTGALPATISIASAIGANKVVADNYAVSDVLLPPTLIASGVTISTATAPADVYALKLAALANMAAPGVNALGVTQALRDDANHSVPMPAGVITGTDGATGVGGAINAMNAAMANAATSIAAPSVLTAAQAIILPQPKVTDLAAAAATYAQAAATATSTQSAPPTLAQLFAAINNAESALITYLTNNPGATQVAAASSVLSTAAATASSVAAVNDLIATGMSAAGLQSYQGSQAALAGAGSGVPVGDVTNLTAGPTAGSYTAKDTTYAYSYTSGTWAADTTGKYSNYVLTASGWVLDSHGGTALNNNDGTITLTDKHGTYTVGVFETRMDGQPLYGSSVTTPTYFPANSLFFYGGGGVSSQDLYELWTNGGVTDLNGNALTSLPSIGTGVCANGFVFTPITPAPTTGDNYNLMGVVFGSGGCTAANISGVTGTSSVPLATVTVQTKATGLNSTSVILITTSNTYASEVNNCILGIAGGTVQVGCPSQFNGGGSGGFTPKGTPIYSSIESHNKTAMDAELQANGLPPLP